MTKEQSFDITLGSDDYVLARGKGNAPSISLGSLPIEPGSRMSIDSIVIPSFHKGFGQKISNGESRYYDSTGLDASIPNAVWPFGVVSNTVTATSTTNSVYAAGNIMQTPDGVTLFILPEAIWSGSGSVKSAIAGCFTGSWAIHGNYVYFGRAEDTAPSTYESLASARYDWTTQTWDAAGVFGGPTASFLYSFGNKLWYVHNFAAGTPPNIYWNDSPTLAGGSLRGPFTPVTYSGRVTGISVLGPYALYMMNNGTVAGIDSEGVFAPIVSDTYADADEPYFGHSSSLFLGNLAVPHTNGLLLISPDLSTVSEIGPFSLMQPTPTISGFAKTRDVSFPPASYTYKNHIWYSDGKNIWHGVSGRDGLSWHFVISGTQVAGLRVYNSTLDAFNVQYLDKSGSDYIAKALPAVHPDGNTGPSSVTTATLTTPFYSGEGLAGCVTKRGVSVRGHATLDTSAPVTSITVKFRVTPEAAFTSLGSFSTANGGYFTLPFPTTSAALGRGFQLELTITPGGISSSYAHINLPLYIDYEYVPSENDYVTLNILAATDPVGRRGASRRLKHTKETITAAIQALIGTITTLKINDSGTTWTVLVEDYTSRQTLDGTVLNSGESIVEVVCRRLA